MELQTVVTAINVAVMAVGAAVLIRTGYLRRREHWSRGSWLGLGLTVVAGLALVGFALVFSAGVDNKEPWVGAPRSDTRNLWVLAATTSLIGGTLVATCTLLWFARGRPTTPFPLARRRPRTASPRAVSGGSDLDDTPPRPAQAPEADAARLPPRDAG